MKKLPFILAILISIIFGFGGGWFYSIQSMSTSKDASIRDTLRDTIIDTIPYRFPVPVESVVVRTEIVKLSLYDSTAPQNTDSISTDSVYVELPIWQKEYADSSYHAWVSGYKVRLDSIKVYPKTIVETQRIRDPPKRWGLGLQVGVGYCGDKVLGPYIGIGISYNILTW